MRTHHAQILVVVLFALMMMYAKVQVIGDARWWNLVMAGLLLGVLALYLWRDRASQR
jgi:hypothetical protein